MNRKLILTTLLISSIGEIFTPKTYASSNVMNPRRPVSPISGKVIDIRPISPTVVVPNRDTSRLKIMAEAMKKEEEAKQALLDQTIELKGLITEKDAEIAMLKEKIAELEKIIKEQVEEINILNLLFSDIQNILNRK